MCYISFFYIFLSCNISECLCSINLMSGLGFDSHRAIFASVSFNSEQYCAVHKSHRKILRHPFLHLSCCGWRWKSKTRVFSAYVIWHACLFSRSFEGDEFWDDRKKSTVKAGSPKGSPCPSIVFNPRNLFLHHGCRRPRLTTSVANENMTFIDQDDFLIRMTLVAWNLGALVRNGTDWNNWNNMK